MEHPELCEWQRLDPETGICEPWFTHPFLDEIKTWNMKEKTILETGCGLSTAWWRSRSRWVDTIEANTNWAQKAHDYCQMRDQRNGEIFTKQIPDGIPEEMPKYFSLIPPEKSYDIIVIDGIYRTEMVEWGIAHLRSHNGGVLMADNFMQDFVWISPKAEELVSEFEIHKYTQPGHVNHEGRPWNTCWWYIDKQ